MKQRGIFALIGIILLIIGLLWLIARQKTSNHSGVSIVASFYPLGYFAQQLVGSHGSVTIVTPAGAEPHEYEPTPGDLAAIQQATVLVLNGGGLEPWGSNAMTLLKGSATKIVVAGDGLLTRQLAGGDTPGVDPHIWLDPVLAKQEVQRIAAALITADSTNQSDYVLNEQRFLAELTVLDEHYRSGLQRCSSRTFVTSHLAFGYLADEYQLKQIGIAGLSPDEEPSPDQLANVTQFVKDNHVSTIFFESLVSPKLAQTIAQETGATTAELNPIEGLTKAQLSNGESYGTVMEQNLANLQTVLGCQK